MAKYTYKTELYKDGKVIACEDYNSLKKQTDGAYSFVRGKLTSEEFPKPYIDETIKSYINALRLKNCSKKKYCQSFHKDDGIVLEVVRFGVK